MLIVFVAAHRSFYLVIAWQRQHHLLNSITLTQSKPCNALHASLIIQINQYNAWHDICESGMTYITFSFWKVIAFYSPLSSARSLVCSLKMWQFFNIISSSNTSFCTVSVWLLDCCLSPQQAHQHIQIMFTIAIYIALDWNACANGQPLPTHQVRWSS